METKDYIRLYARERPLFLSVLRGKEAALYQKYLPFKHPILDVGCGDGFFARITMGKNKIDVGLDVGDSRVRDARGSGAYKRVVVYDGLTIPFRAGFYKTVISNSVLEHVDNLPQVLNQLYRVVAPGGTFITTVMAAPWEEYLFGTKVFGKSYQSWMKRKQVHKNLLTYQGWVAAFRNAGFVPKATIPYLSRRAGALLDVLHYASLPSLVTYTSMKTWVMWPQGTSIYPYQYFAAAMDERVSLHRAGSLFFVLKRK